MANNSAGIDQEVLALLSEKLSQEEKHARYMVHYRKTRKAEVAQLKQTFQELERLRTMLKQRPPRILPWRQVAKALADARELGEAQQKALVAQLRMHSELLRTMVEWVELNTPIQMPLDAQCMTWRHVSLPNDPTTRRLAKEWITQQMLHNMDVMFHRHGFPAWDSNDVIDDADVSCEFGNDVGYTMVIKRDYKTATLSLADYRTYIHSTFRMQYTMPNYAADMPLLEDSIDGETRQVVVVSSNELTNVVFREVMTTDRYVFIVQQIQDDQRFSVESTICQQRNRMFWCDNRTLADGAIRFRFLGCLSHPLKPCQGLESEPAVDSLLEADARLWGVDWGDCPTHVRQYRYPKLWWEIFGGQLNAQKKRLLSKSHNT
ncbi:Aste57867_7306 [Aphanomyces stellatus]|uniref:Aste57867_7306 protein n=1 Tax=Aphanomyces stellatus TaxID=120398 RepID=A0A485KI43_9STRA|nr:hypothetical protein As57867_007280 [Aphanomyces stellatus]VFT84225.1 Aste57867_7306 [Aphanomyces stellatus]